MNLKPFFFLFLAIILSANIIAQTTVEIKYSNEYELYLQEHILSNQTTVEKLVEILGEPSKIEEYKSGETSYFYEEIGIVFFTRENILKGMGINFNWEGDKHFPEQTFTGKLLLAELQISTGTTSKEVASIEGIAFGCPISSMCASVDREAKVNCLLFYNEGKLNNVSFLIDREEE